MQKNKLLLYTILFWLFGTSLLAQNNTNSPYSRIAYGNLNDNGLSLTRSMGGVGAALRSDRGINALNPASYTATDSTDFKFDIGVFMKYSSFVDNSGSRNHKVNGNLGYVALSIPLGKYFALSGGLLPYSDMGYNVQLSDSIDYMDDSKMLYHNTYKGGGGLTSYYLGFAGIFLKRVSLGANVKYINGILEKSQTISFPNNGEVISSFSNSSLRVNALSFDFGIQYQEIIAKKHKIVLGGTYSPKMRMYTEYQEFFPKDSTTTKDLKFDMPQSFSVGVAYTYDNQLSLVFDYKKEFWSQAAYKSKLNVLNDRTKYAVGVEYVRNQNSLKYIERVRWHVGANVYNSYYAYKGSSVNGFGMNVAVSFPVRQSKTLLNAMLEYEQNGNVKINSLRESIVKITIGATINESWFNKRKFN